MTRAIGYARLSKANEKSVSIEYQIEAIQKLAQEKGFDLVDVQIDYGISGAEMSNRPGVQAVLKAVEAHKVDAVLVYRSDRLSRNGIEGLIARQLFDRNGVQYWSVTEGLLKYDIMGFVQEGMSREERKKISERTKQALAHKKAQGQRIGCQLPYGNKVEKGTVIVIDSEQALVALIHRLHISGLSLRKIVDSVNAAGHRTRKGTAFGLTQVVRILKKAA